MRTRTPQQSESPRRVNTQDCPGAPVRPAPRPAARLLPAISAASAAFCAAQLFFGVALAAQPPAAAHPHKKPAAAKLAAQPAPVPAPAPVLPPPPNWPARDKPAEASVVWDSRGLLIQASNSSLDQILKEISLKTGATVEGMGADERVFGTYGPGPARDVLAQLLDGSGYNILMVGDMGQGTPRRIVLSGRPSATGQPSGNANPGANNENEQENDQEADQPQLPPNPSVQAPYTQPGPNGAPAVPVRTPQQIMQPRPPFQPQMPQQPQYNPQ